MEGNGICITGEDSGCPDVVNENLGVGGAFAFPRLIGEFDSTDLRALNLLSSYHM